MKKLTVIIWIILGILLLLAVIDLAFPILFATSVFLKVFEIFFEALGGDVTIYYRRNHCVCDSILSIQ